MAVAAEDLAVRDATVRLGRGGAESNKSPRARTISLHYLRPNKSSVDLVAWTNNDDGAVKKRGGSSQVEARRGHRLCNTATIVWADKI